MEKTNSNMPEKNREKKVKQPQKPNLFLGKTKTQQGNAKFPDWDILPPYQFINPRIKSSS
ncbi:hypothetical protein [uncultured Chryseobacterium sp.]|uniref:hypothetical protein n=1 Tax=uncultured Chryseobacterium sp. TaxID=259322 RepID=UPI0025F8B880|nr:hypothetical protein [uncultured Chryseobacterium sp.]